MRTLLSFSRRYPAVIAALYRGDIDSWNAWRLSHPRVVPDLSGLDLARQYLFDIDLSRAILIGANLSRACLIGANLTGADLTEADLTGAYIRETNLSGARLTMAQLKTANLGDAIVTDAQLSDAAPIALPERRRSHDQPFAVEAVKRPRFTQAVNARRAIAPSVSMAASVWQVALKQRIMPVVEQVGPRAIPPVAAAASAQRLASDYRTCSYLL